jgi:hypothetical protein
MNREKPIAVILFLESSIRCHERQIAERTILFKADHIGKRGLVRPARNRPDPNARHGRRPSGIDNGDAEAATHSLIQQPANTTWQLRRG